MVNKAGLPNGPGTMYFQNGRVFREGLFSDGGFISGHEYRITGIPRFSGLFESNLEGINYPKYGKFYNERGHVQYHGPFKTAEVALGDDTPVVTMPSEYGPIEDSDAPNLREKCDEILEIEKNDGD